MEPESSPRLLVYLHIFTKSSENINFLYGSLLSNLILGKNRIPLNVQNGEPKFENRHFFQNLNLLHFEMKKLYF